ncbi:hypothetical protein FACS189472_18190 [Alphaproteobacteria bacterium]|nr:hypothetical protein FACS189472_18190 [Alphaproteobacteria bacterium]
MINDVRVERKSRIAAQDPAEKRERVEEDEDKDAADENIFPKK